MSSAGSLTLKVSEDDSNGPSNSSGTREEGPRSLHSNCLRCLEASCPPLLVLRRNEFLQHGGAHQVRRQQSLAQDEVVKFLLIEFLAKCRLGFLAQRQQPGVAVEIAVRLAGAAEGEALDFFLGKSVAQQDIFLQH